jgi:hypothetical protein
LPFKLTEKPNVDITFKGSGVSVRTSDSNSKGSLIDINMDGADLFVSYKVSGWPKPSVKWFHQNSLIQPSQFNNSLFILQNVSEPDLGTYQIVVGNDLGTTEASFSLQRVLIAFINCYTICCNNTLAMCRGFRRDRFFHGQWQ